MFSSKVFTRFYLPFLPICLKHILPLICRWVRRIKKHLPFTYPSSYPTYTNYDKRTIHHHSLQ